MVTQVSGWFWARRDTRWDVYPQEEPLVLLRVEPWHMYFEDGAETRTGYILVREAEAPLKVSA
jgi:hypothetical protein